jgi:hypothetical protein
MICSSVYRLFFIQNPPVYITRELQLPLVEFFGGRSSIAPGDLALKSQEQRWVGKLDIFLVQREDGSVHARVSGQTIALRLLPATYQEAQTSGVPFEQVIDREQKTGSIRVIVVDENSGHIGSITVPATAMQGKWQ